MSTSSGRLVDPRDPHRWTPRFLLGSGRARARPQPVPMTLLRPASLPLPRQRSTSSGDPAAARLPVPSSVVCRALHNCRYFVIPYVRRFYLSASTSKRWTFRTGTVIGSFRERYRFLCHLSTSGSNYNQTDSEYRFGVQIRRSPTVSTNSAMLTCAHVFHRRTYFP